MAPPNKTMPTTGSARPFRPCFYECSICTEMLNEPAPETKAKPTSLGASSVLLQNSNGGNPPQPGPSNGSGSSSGGGVVKIKPDVENRSGIVATQCGHMYHKVCIKKWIEEERPRCPVCNLFMTMRNTFDLFPSISNAQDAAGSCDRLECEDQRRIHATLVEDVNRLQARVNGLEDSMNVKEALLRSMESQRDDTEVEFLSLKRKLEQERRNNGGPAGAVRRRRRQ